MKRTPLKRKTPLLAKTALKKHKVINPLSAKKRQRLQKERKIRQQLMDRCQGRCEWCGRLPDFRGLHPHEKVFRSHGGKLSLENSVMLCGRCHAVKGHNLREV